jgi:hypothetical protein
MSKSTTLLLVLTGTVAGTALGSGLLILASPASARQPAEPGAQQPRDPSRMAAGAGDMKTATATVEGIDKEKRMLTLKTEDGKTTSVNVPEDVEAFERIKKGDKIRVSYQESMALAVHRPGEAKPEEQIKETTERVQGSRPGRYMERKQTMSAEIVSIDSKKNLVKVKGPQGKVHEIAVKDPAMRERIKELKPGEVVEVTYTEAMAISLEPTGK